MTNQDPHLEALQDIRNMMKRSTRFLSLSGLSGVFAGLYAITGALLVNYYMTTPYYDFPEYSSRSVEFLQPRYRSLYPGCFIIAACVLGASLLTAFYFSWRKARKNGEKLLNHTAWRMLFNMAIPLVAGGIFCLAMIYHSHAEYVAPATLIFYGMALVNGSKYTYDDIRYLGLLEITLGLFSTFFLRHGLYFWIVGFGLLHILYGGIVWWKYERAGKKE